MGAGKIAAGAQFAAICGEVLEVWAVQSMSASRLWIASSWAAIATDSIATPLDSDVSPPVSDRSLSGICPRYRAGKNG